MASGGWNTIESDAGVFTFLLDSIGVRGVQFEELLSLDPSDVRILSPMYGVIFLLKYPTNIRPNADGTANDGTFDHNNAENVFFAQQTIQNACGTQALLSVLLNTDDKDVELGETLKEVVILLFTDAIGTVKSLVGAFALHSFKIGRGGV